MFLVYKGRKNPKVVEWDDRKFEFTPGKAAEVPKGVGHILLAHAPELFAEVAIPEEAKLEEKPIEPRPKSKPRSTKTK